MADESVSRSRFLSLVLRHRPEVIGISLDPAGWIEVEVLLAALAAHGRPLTRGELEALIATNVKQRFALSPDGLRIRASQGHSLPVELGYPPEPPPGFLYHGTARRFLAAILREGILRGRRHHVHLSAEAETATRVGARHGAPVVLEVAAGAMHAAGFLFFRSENGVWLTDRVPPEHLQPLEDQRGATTR